MHNDLEFEKDFWGDCCNTFGEDQKHYIYGNHMGLTGQNGCYGKCFYGTFITK